ncbi:hypothetical protein CHS0354_004622 [Potamilus streckersoni]|uniref:Uncharacterized protein n=1 Tax=Potamilus streckersoni TaxID=2493646 RepID=A0AAE0S4R7_9BIVA|nr:hypothetical protein CHS0354_004622 [Potamilus streckersoni]
MGLEELENRRTRTAGGGCWIHVPKCPAHTSVKSMFYDAWGAANMHTVTSVRDIFTRVLDRIKLISKSFQRSSTLIPQAPTNPTNKPDWTYKSPKSLSPRKYLLYPTVVLMTLINRFYLYSHLTSSRLENLRSDACHTRPSVGLQRLQNDRDNVVPHQTRQGGRKTISLLHQLKILPNT